MAMFSPTTSVRAVHQSGSCYTRRLAEYCRYYNKEATMKGMYIWLPVVIVSSFIAGTLVPAGRAQQGTQKPPKYIEVDYMKATPGHEDEYLKLEREQWKPIHQERIKEGKIHSWYLFGVRFPSGSESKYDFVTVNTFDQFGQMENSYADIEQVMSKVHSGINVNDFASRTNKSRDLVRSEVWELIDQLER